MIGVQLARGRAISDLLGAYSIVGEGGYDVDQALRFWLWHVEELALYVGIVPIVALVVLLARAGKLPARLDEHLAATIALVVTSTLVVATFASRFAPDRIQDRYLFFLTPLLVVALLAWVELGAPRSRLALGVGALVAIGLVVAFPYVRFIGEPAKSDTLGLLPLWSVNEHLLGDSYRLTVLVGAALLVGLMVLVPARLAVAVPVAAARALRRALAARLVRAAGRASLGRGSALPGDPRRRPRLDRRRGTGGRGGRRSLDRTRRSLHREPERVLQPAGRETSTTRRRPPPAVSARPL